MPLGGSCQQLHMNGFAEGSATQTEVWYTRSRQRRSEDGSSQTFFYAECVAHFLVSPSHGECVCFEKHWGSYLPIDYRCQRGTLTHAEIHMVVSACSPQASHCHGNSWGGGKRLPTIGSPSWNAASHVSWEDWPDLGMNEIQTHICVIGSRYRQRLIVYPVDFVEFNLIEPVLEK